LKETANNLNSDYPTGGPQSKYIFAFRGQWRIVFYSSKGFNW